MRKIGQLKSALSVVVLLVLVGGLWFQREILADALSAIGALSSASIAVLAILAVIERVSRAELVRSMLAGVSLGRAEVISDVGAAINKGVPLGGPVATVVRWQIARSSGVAPVSFVVMLVATGVATAFVSWMYPLAATVIDTLGRATTLVDLGIIALCSAVLIGSAAFWYVVLTTERASRWLESRSDWLGRRFGSIVPAVVGPNGSSEFAPATAEAIDRLREIARRPIPVLVRAAVAQGVGALVLWVAFVGVGISIGGGSELGATEFARVFFVAHILGSLAPTPGGVGVVEAGLTGSMVAAGVAAGPALAGVLIYRFVTYLLPIIVGTVLYFAWQRTGWGRSARRGGEFVAEPATH